jgi:WD40 repeat protein
VAFSPDGKTILTGSQTGRSSSGHDHGKHFGSFLHTRVRVTAVAFSPDGETI